MVLPFTSPLWTILIDYASTIFQNNHGLDHSHHQPSNQRDHGPHHLHRPSVQFQLIRFCLILKFDFLNITRLTISQHPPSSPRALAPIASPRISWKASRPLVTPSRWVLIWSATIVQLVNQPWVPFPFFRSSSTTLLGSHPIHFIWVQYPHWRSYNCHFDVGRFFCPWTG
jgi:hypothetical protein